VQRDALMPCDRAGHVHQLAVVQLVAPAIVRPFHQLGVGDASIRRRHLPHSSIVIPGSCRAPIACIYEQNRALYDPTRAEIAKLGVRGRGRICAKEESP
jgi:hypothetical protein